jgi:DNA polymerase-1
MEVIKTGGWLKTIAGLPLYISNVQSQIKSEYEHAMRCAVNYPIQGSSQDILKLALVGVKNKMNLTPVLMVHDELVYELPDSSFLEQAKQIIEIMESCYTLDVPLEVEALRNDRWSKN